MTVTLSVHRNKLEARRKRDLAASTTRDIAKVIKDSDIRAFAFVGIDAEGKLHALWDTGAVLPMWAFPATMADGLRREMEEYDGADDWKPALSARGVI